jgi:hypothetical protein
MPAHDARKPLWLKTTVGNRFTSIYGYNLGQTRLDFSRAWQLTEDQARREGWDKDLYAGLISDAFELLNPLLKIALSEILRASKPKKRKKMKTK